MAAPRPCGADPSDVRKKVYVIAVHNARASQHEPRLEIRVSRADIKTGGMRVEYERRGRRPIDCSVSSMLYHSISRVSAHFVFMCGRFLAFVRKRTGLGRFWRPTLWHFKHVPGWSIRDRSIK